MRFPCSFVRYVGATPSGGTSLGGDATPTGPLTQQLDNVLYSRFSNINGWPIHRIALAYSGSSGVLSTKARIFLYEDSTAQWYQVGADVTIAPGFISYFDVCALLEIPNTQANLVQATSGSVQVFIQVDKPSGAPDGTYSVAVAPDLTTQA